MIIIFLLAFLGILVGASIYLSQRFAWYFETAGTWPFYIIFAGITIFMIVGVMGLTNSTRTAGHDRSVSPHSSPDGPTIQKTLGNMNIWKDQPGILLHHSPDGIKYASKAGIDLYLAGHTHAGQLWPATHMAKIMFEFNKGLHNFEGTQLYMSQGTGTFGPPMRVGTDNELTILHIKPE
nr:hypothetical protein [Bacteroidota bacterium]